MPRILLIDDDPALRHALCLALEKSGYAVAEYGDGRQALAAFMAQPADLVVTDIVMPEADGIETIRAFRKLNPVLPIIAMSGSGRIGSPSDYLKMARMIGASWLMAKPLEIDALRATVAQLLRSHETPSTAG
jgi:DNA-binding response OmpR family regulator